MADENSVGMHKTSIQTGPAGATRVVYHKTAVVPFTDKTIVLDTSMLQWWVFMPAETQPESQSTPAPETLLALKETLFAAWRQLPPVHQASVALTLLGEVGQGEWGEWLREAISLLPMGRPEGGREKDLFDLGAVPEEVYVQSEPTVAGKPDRGGDGQAAPADFDDWMEQVDAAVWRMVACSVHDLPDYDYQALFQDGALPREAADEALIAAGFSRLA